MGLLLIRIKAHPLSSILFIKWINRLVNGGLIYYGKILLIQLFIVGFLFIRTNSLMYLTSKRRPLVNKSSWCHILLINETVCVAI
jgi:hypothetical protein